MINSTTPILQGSEIKTYHGIVTGEAILGANVIKDIFANFRDFFGGRSGAYEKELQKARTIAFEEMNKEAEDLGCNAIVGIDINYETVGSKGSMLMVSVCGTAVKV